MGAQHFALYHASDPLSSCSFATLQSGGESVEVARPIRLLAGGPGFEPELIGPEPIGLPLPHPPTGQRKCYYSTSLCSWQAFTATFFAYLT